MATTPKKPAYGLVCQTADDRVRFRTITRTRLLALSRADADAKLRELYADNIARLEGAVLFCKSLKIRLFRVPSGLLPFADHDLGEPLVEEFVPALARAGDAARQHGVRLISHPDQFVVLNSESETVRQNSVRMLNAEARVFDALGLPRSPWAAINVHGGKGGRPEELVVAIRALPTAVRSRLTIENDERAYGAEAVVDICKRAGVPMIFDAHHHLVKERLASYDDASIAHFTAQAAGTWNPCEWQIVHISNGREHLHDPRHSEYVSEMPPAFRCVPFIEIEAKAKERAVMQWNL